MVNNGLWRMRAWLWPGTCLMCAERTAPGAELCPPCERELPRLGPCCPQCAAPAPVVPSVPCGECQKRPPAFVRAHALFRYEEPVDRLILGLKFHRQLRFARVLGGWLASHLAELDEPLPDVIMPVPLHPGRLRSRGYNQALELARPIARRFGLPLDYHSVQRVRVTLPQSRLTREARRRNIRNAFQARCDLTGQRIAIVDDVMTSGHTANTLALCLRRAGAAETVVWVAARAA